MTKVLIWDVEEQPSPGDWTVALWRSLDVGTKPDRVSIPGLVEANAEVLRKRYLAWIYELGETPIKGRRFVDHLELRPGFSYWWMTLLAEKCNYSKSPQIGDAIRLMAFDQWAADRPVDAVLLASANLPLVECIRLWCSKKGVVFDWQRVPGQASKLPRMRRFHEALPKPLQALAWLPRYIFERWALRGVGLVAWRQTQARVTFVSYLFNLVPEAAKEGRYESRYWAHLPDELQREQCKTNWLHLYVKDVCVPGARDAAGAIRDFNKAGQGRQIHVTHDSFLSTGVVCKALMDWGRTFWIGKRLQKAISSTTTEGLDLWPLFAKDWGESMFGRTAMSNALYLNLFESAMKSLPKQRVGVYLLENQGWEFALAWSWEAAGQGCIVGCPHSTVRFWDLRYFFDPRSYSRTGNNRLPLPNKVALNGAAATDAYLAGGYPPDDLVQVEALRYLHLQGTRARPRTEASSPKQSLRILVLGDYLLSQTRLQISLLEQAARLLPAGTIITIKPHPACPIRPADYPGLAMTVTMDPIFKLLPECDVAYASAATAAAADAYCAGVPVVSVLDPNALNLSPLRGCEGAFVAGTPEELAHQLISAAGSSSRSTEMQQNFFTIDQKLPRWRKLLLDFA